MPKRNVCNLKFLGSLFMRLSLYQCTSRKVCAKLLIKMKRLFLISALFFLLTIFSPQDVSAQYGTFTCGWQVRGCGVVSDTCVEGFRIDAAYCGGFSRNDCDTAPVADCVPNTCSSVGGTCKTSCIVGQERTPPVDPTRDCTGGAFCCIPYRGPAVNILDPRCGTAGTGIDTAIGCIPVSDTNALIGFILRWAMGIGGGIAFLLILVAGFLIITSQGDPQKVQAGKELLTSAIAGLLLIIFSVFILEIIGVDILDIPGFGT